MKALILCGGLGARLRSALSDTPKSMAPVGGKPFLRYQIDWLKKYGITEIILCVGYKADHIKNYFGDGSAYGVKIVYSEENVDNLLGTGGAIKKAQEVVPELAEEVFLVLNGDTYAKIDFNKLLKFHHSKRSKFTLTLAEVKDPSRYGGVSIDLEGKIVSFHEKRAGGGNINSGVYVFEPEILNIIPANQKISLEENIFPLLVQDLMYGYFFAGSFIDIGLPESYKQLQHELLQSILIKEDLTIKETMVRIDQTGLGMALIVDENGKLEGIITDGDIRRFIIKEEDLNRKVKEVMFKNPVAAKIGWSEEKIRSLINPRVKHIPFVDDEGIVKDILLAADIGERFRESITIRAKAPLRVSFAGGGTDIYQYFKDCGGYVLSSTIDKYCRGTLVKRNDCKIMIHSFDFDLNEEFSSIKELIYNGNLDLIKAVIKLMNPSFGFDLYLYSDVPPGTGLGSSASVAAVVASLLNYLKEESLDDYQLSELIYKAEREEINIAGGWQDQYAAVFGGFNFMEFMKEEIVVHPLRVPQEIIEELNNNLFLCYTGKTRSSGEIQSRLVKKQDQDSDEKSEDVISALGRLKEITLKTRSALLKGKMEDFGQLLHEGWANKKRLDNRITDSHVNELYETAIKHGALGGKVLGAGGGGYLLFFCSPLKKKEVMGELEKIGGKIVNFNFDHAGVTSWLVRK